jgi:hypothetical protein
LVIAQCRLPNRKITHEIINIFLFLANKKGMRKAYLSPNGSLITQEGVAVTPLGTSVGQGCTPSVLHIGAHQLPLK